MAAANDNCAPGSNSAAGSTVRTPIEAIAIGSARTTARPRPTASASANNNTSARRTGTPQPATNAYPEANANAASRPAVLASKRAANHALRAAAKRNSANPNDPTNAR